MDDEQSGKRRRGYSFRPNDIPCSSSFSLKYISYLLPSLLRIAGIGSCRGDEGKEMKKKEIVRFEIDMALVLSIGDEFKWSHALKQKLRGYSALLSTAIRTYPKNILARHFSFAEKLHRSFPYPPVQRTLVDTENYRIIVNPNTEPTKPRVRRGALVLRKSGVKKWAASEEKEDVNECLGLLRSMIPGGEEMCLSELVTEVGSYVSCLQFQVELLRALVS